MNEANQELGSILRRSTKRLGSAITKQAPDRRAHKSGFLLELRRCFRKGAIKTGLAGPQSNMHVENFYRRGKGMGHL